MVQFKRFHCLILIWLNFALPFRKYPINCLWYNNTCVHECPPWMVLKKTKCNQAYWIAQRTCENPDPGLEGASCRFSRCDCPEPMVYDTRSGHCCDFNNCPQEDKNERKIDDYIW